MRNAILTLALFAVSSIAAPAPYPVTINSRAQTAPPLTVYRAAESLFRVSFVDGDTASDITGTTAFMSFATNASAAVVSTASVSVVAGMTGVVDCVFSPSAVNVAAGRYMYEVGVTPIGGTARIYRQGVFTVAASPYAGSAAAVTWATNMTWGTINWTGLPDWLLVSETAGWETGSHAGFVTNSADFYPVSNPSNYITIADVPAQTSQLYVASAGTVTGPQSNIIATALQSEADTNALAAIAALKVKMRWDTSDANVYDTIEGGTNWVVYRISTVPSATNLMVTLSDDFEDTITHTRPSWTNHVWPFNEEGWSGAEFYPEGTVQYVITPPVSAAAWSAITPFTLPAVLLPSGGAQGTATVSIASIVYPTNELYRVDIPALTNLAARLAGLAGTDTVTLVSSALGTHTNDAGIHVTSGDKELIDSIPGLTQSVAAVSGAFAGFTNSIPAAGCSVLSMTDETNLVVTGSTYAYTAQVTTNYWLSIAPTAPAYHYSLTVYGTNACTLADNMRLIGTKMVTWTNCVAFKPWTNGLWEVLWGGK